DYYCCSYTTWSTFLF
nr:immunoglobulin light chain junction region [Macaca mulatta]